MDASPRDEDREVIAGSLDREGIVEELVLYGIVIVEAKEGVLAEHIGETEEVEMECMIADDESVIGEGAENHRLFGGYDAKRLLDRFDTCDQVRVGAGAANAREELGNRGDGFSLHCVRVEALEFLNGKFNFFDGAVFDKHVQPGRPFDLGDFFDAELTEFGYLMHRIDSQLTTYNG